MSTNSNTILLETLESEGYSEQEAQRLMEDMGEPE